MTMYERIESLCDGIEKSIEDMLYSVKIPEDVFADLKAGNEDNLSDDVVRDIAEYLNTSADYLYRWTDDPTNYEDPALLDYVPKAILDEWLEEGLSEEEMGHRAVEREKALYEDHMRESGDVVEATPVYSGSIASLGYENGTLYVRFHKGGAYAYFDVPASEYEALRFSGAPGKYFGANIRNQYRYRKID